jgi:hypothetical protein
MARMEYATRIWGRDGLEYTGDVYPTLSKAIKGARESIKEMKKNRQIIGADWNVYEWRGAYGEAVAGSDI